MHNSYSGRSIRGRARHLRRKAISPLIATLILIAITITGGVVVYRLFYSTAGVISQNLHVTVTEASVSAVGQVSVTAKNDGNLAITSLTMTVLPTLGLDTYVCVPTVAIITPLAPGGSVSCTTSGATYPTVGVPYDIRITSGTATSSAVTDVSVIGAP